MSLNVVMTPVGSAGDVLPFLAIGHELRARGHRVTVITAEPFADAARRAGLAFDAFPSAEVFERTVADPELWDPVAGYRVVMERVSEGLAEGYQRVAQHAGSDDTVLVGHSISFATRVYEERHGTPAVTLHLAPSIFRSDHAQPALASFQNLSRWPRQARRAFWWAIDRFALDPPVLPALNALRASQGLPRVRRVMRGWLHSPKRVIALFPEWFGPRQADWPENLDLVGFPLGDGPDEELDPGLVRFLEAGDPPLLFTPGSANRHASKFFSAAVRAAARLDRRALLLTRYPEQVPARLPGGVRHVFWAPLRALVPCCTALVHHGGIGTSAQGLAAGCPQLVMPLGFDQADNAARLERLGVARWLSPDRFEAARVADTISALLGSAEALAACRRCQGLTLEDRAVGRAADLVESACDGTSTGPAIQR